MLGWLNHQGTSIGKRWKRNQGTCQGTRIQDPRSGIKRFIQKSLQSLGKRSDGLWAVTLGCGEWVRLVGELPSDRAARRRALESRLRIAHAKASHVVSKVANSSTSISGTIGQPVEHGLIMAIIDAEWL